MKNYRNGYEIVRGVPGPEGTPQPAPAKANPRRDPGADSTHKGAGVHGQSTTTADANKGSITPPDGIHPVAKKHA